MNIESYFSQNSSKMKASKIRELMKYASMKDVISLAGGIPDPENFPFTEVKSIINNWGNDKVRLAMQYGPTNGFPPLLNLIKKRMNEKRNIDMTNQDIIITTGGQQAIFLITKIFIDQDDIIIVEQPSFIGAMAAFLANGAKLLGIDLKDDGANIDSLENLLKKFKSKNKKPKFFYTIPNFQNPAGVSMSVKKRKALYELAIKNDLIIIEDDPYCDLYFTDTYDQYLPIKSLGNEAAIIYIGSFSKILCPGFRLGWIIGDTAVIDKIALAKQSVDACSSSFGQVTACDYLEQGLIDGYLEKMRKIYKEKKEFMIQNIKKFMPMQIKYTNPDGGFFLYLDLPDKLNAEQIFKKCIEQKVAFVTGEPFHINTEEGNKHIRLSFSNSSFDEIKKGIEVIGKVIKELI